MGTMVYNLPPMLSSVPMVLVIEETRVDSAKGEERDRKEEMFGPLQGTRQHDSRWSKGKDGHRYVLCGQTVEPIHKKTRKEMGQHNQEPKHGNLLWNLLKEFREGAGTTVWLHHIKDPTPVVVFPTFRTPHSLIFGLHDGARLSVGLWTEPLQDMRYGAIKEPAPEIVVPSFRTPPSLIFRLHDGTERSVDAEIWCSLQRQGLQYCLLSHSLPTEHRWS